MAAVRLLLGWALIQADGDCRCDWALQLRHAGTHPCDWHPCTHQGRQHQVPHRHPGCYLPVYPQHLQAHSSSSRPWCQACTCYGMCLAHMRHATMHATAAGCCLAACGGRTQTTRVHAPCMLRCQLLSHRRCHIAYNCECTPSICSDHDYGAQQPAELWILRHSSLQARAGRQVSAST